MFEELEEYINVGDDRNYDVYFGVVGLFILLIVC